MKILRTRFVSLLCPLLLLFASAPVSAFPVMSSSHARTTLSLHQRGEVNLPLSLVQMPFQQSNSVFYNKKPCTCIWQSKKNDVEDNIAGNVVDDDVSISSLPTWTAFGTLLALPVVWISLYFVMTTGGGLPAGPFGLLGALEGVSYLAVVAIVAVSLYQKLVTTTGTGFLPAGPKKGLRAAVEGLSYLTLLLALLALVSLVVEQGCVPNAKPILDYSAYLPVCDPEQTPGLFGSS